MGCPWNNLPRHRNPDTPLQTRKFKDKTGADRWVTEVICENFQFVQSAKDRAEQQQAEPARRSRVQENTQTYDDGEVPF